MTKGYSHGLIADELDLPLGFVQETIAQYEQSDDWHALHDEVEKYSAALAAAERVSRARAERNRQEYKGIVPSSLRR